MELTSGLPFWPIRDGLIGVYPPLTQDLHCDALIVGGGITGALLSHELTRRGVDCVLIDRREIGHGSTCASTALLQYELDIPLRELCDRVGIKAAERSYTLGVEAIRRLQKLAGSGCDFAPRPSLLLARRKADVPNLGKEYVARRRADLPVTWLDGSELARRHGIESYAAIRSAVAAETDPYRLTHRLMRQSAQRGLRIFDRTTALRYHEAKSKMTVETDRGAKVSCRGIFFASGYETQDILPKNIVTFKSTYAFISEPIEKFDWWKDRTLIWDTGNPYLYMRTTGDNRVIVGGEDDGVLDPTRRDRRIPEKTHRLLTRFARVFPGRRIESAFGWAGIFGGTKDGLAYIGRYKAFPLGYFALGFGGNGITFSVIASRLLADAFLGRKNRDEAMFRFDR
jgi:glycine/D-amino acid oxidase-like deaminating enzyme